LITLLAFPLIEKIIRQSLEGDTDSLQLLSSIENQVIQINCVDMNFTCYLIPTPQGIDIESKPPKTHDTQLDGTLVQFIKMLTRGIDGSLKEFPLTVSGNTHNLSALKEVLMRLDIDWEAILSDYIGNTAAYVATRVRKKIMAQVRESKDSVKSNLKEYSQIEADLLPLKSEVNEFYEDIAALHNDIERLQTRLFKYLKGQSK